MGIVIRLVIRLGDHDCLVNYFETPLWRTRGQVLCVQTDPCACGLEECITWIDHHLEASR